MSCAQIAIEWKGRFSTELDERNVGLLHSNGQPTCLLIGTDTGKIPLEFSIRSTSQVMKREPREM